MSWEIITNTLTILASGSALIVYLAKTISGHLLTRDVERFRAELKASHDTAIEHLRADLRIQAFEQETTFSRLHDKRVQVIEELYKRIAVVNLAMNRLMSDVQVKGGPSLEEQAQKAADAADDFLEYYLHHQIYFDQTLCDKLQAFNEKMHGAWVAFNMSKCMVDSGTQRHETWQAAWKAISEDLPKIRREIESSFRSILGQKTL
jgi:hypothetical protein